MASPPVPPLHPQQTFRIDRVARTALTNAPYNPRRMSKAARARLTASLGTHGLVQPLIWNRRTGHLVAGHQRLTILDANAPSADYTLDVAVVDLPVAAEAALNVALNNESLMGTWDIDKLRDLPTTVPDLPFEALGFSEDDVLALFGPTAPTPAPPAAPPPPAPSRPEPPPATPLAGSRTTTADRAPTGQVAGPRAAPVAARLYVTIECETQAQRDHLLDRLNYPPGDGRRLPIVRAADILALLPA